MFEFAMYVVDSWNSSILLATFCDDALAYKRLAILVGSVHESFEHGAKPGFLGCDQKGDVPSFIHWYSLPAVKR